MFSASRNAPTLTAPLLKGLGWVALILIFSCGDNEKNLNRPLVAMEDQVLRKEQLLEVIPKNLNKEDSLLFAEHFIKSWVIDLALYQQAQKNIKNSKEIERKVDEFRKALIVNTFINDLVSSRLKAPSEKEIVDFYKNDSTFLLSESIIKGFMLKVPLNAADLKQLRQWCKDEVSGASDTKNQHIANIEKYCVQNASIYEFFYDKWQSFSKLLENIPFQLTENETIFLKANKYVETQDSSFYYFLNIKEYLLEKDKQPYEFAKPIINDILTNQRKIGFIQKVKEDLYENAIKQHKVKIYY
ncbi:MAG: peptidyl-prolyl cis-trans isomerase [Bacteroidales bacterium]|jgi:hypothetical protein|nr:peptidyl-prolyl cis-trans isomerase [Bacteroidales bacterium]